MSEIKNLITSVQTITGSWADIGDEIESDGYKDIGFWIKVTANDSQNIQFRYLAKHTSGHADEYEIMIETISSGIESEDPVIHELTRDIDQKIFHHFSIQGEIPFLQAQVRAITPGATQGLIDEIKYDLV